MTDQHSLHNPLLGTVTIAQPTAEVWQRAELDLEHPVARRETNARLSLQPASTYLWVGSISKFASKAQSHPSCAMSSVTVNVDAVCIYHSVMLFFNIHLIEQILFDMDGYVSYIH